MLTHLGNIAIPPLIDILEDEDTESELRWYAARTLGKFQHPKAIAPLIELFKTDEDEELKAMAATALMQMGTVAIAALKNLNGEAAHQQLQQLANNATLTPDLQQGIAIALAEW